MDKDSFKFHFENQKQAKHIKVLWKALGAQA